ncbi:MAG TPA: peptidoglycan DD-metalloendopeptidase family protein [Rhodocyclaceae bacterium]|nr:peptidoglycan DD-metalloendopeptidase family protein [Rhodocyclaceae bacterium]
MPTKAKPSNRAALLGALAVLSIWAAGTASSAPQKAELKEQQSEVRGRIEALRRDLAKSEESRAYAVDQLRETESAISDANRGLRQLADKRGGVQGEMKALESQSRRLADETTQQQRQLSDLLYRNFKRGNRIEMDALSMLAAGHDPNQAALDYQFFRRLSLAKAELITDLRTKAQEKKRLAEAAQEKAAELAAIEQKQKDARGRLVEQQNHHKVLLAQTSERIKAQRQEIGALQRDEKRLGRLIEGLARITKHAAKPKAGRSAPGPAPAQNERTPDPSQAGGAFAALRGKLHLPVRGEIASRFGKPRPEGGTTWKGLFIRAPEGSEVKAVAGGEVVFADWLRGFGNLLVIDHGDAFLSVYGNNQSLLKETGQQVTPGEVVATVGNTGGSPESGLYFELRHQGQAFDPIRWVSLR